MSKNKAQKFFRSFKITTQMLGYIWKEEYGKRYMVVTTIGSLLNAFFPFVYSFMPGLIINELLDEQRMQTICLYLGALLITPIISQIINYFINNTSRVLENNLRLKFECKFLYHSMRLDYATLENPEFQANRDRAEGAMHAITDNVSRVNTLISSVVSLIAISAIVFTLSPIIIISTILAIYINSLFAKAINKRLNKIDIELSLFDRFMSCYMWMMEGFEFAKEIRLYKLESFLLKKYFDKKDEANMVDIKRTKLGNSPGVFNSFTYFIQQCILYVYLVYGVLKKNMPVGNMTIYISIASQFSGALNRIVSTCLDISSKNPRQQEYIDFINLPTMQNKSGDKVPNLKDDFVVEFKNVSFKYPGSENYAIKNLNLTIHKNEKLCIVGVNGSGKTTFTKLLTKLYLPTEGEILLNGVNINEYDNDKYQNLFSPVFQDFASFYMSIEDNIVLASEKNSEKLDTVCKQSGIMGLVDKHPGKYDTQVGKWFDDEGFEPSGGEGQRIAIARACYHEGEIFLLDEPTAALDPMAEYEIYTQFNNMITDKCAVLITHRLSAVQLADKVAVFDNGRVVEYGSHQELYAKGGIYTEMFDKQAQFYRDVPKDAEKAC